MKKMSLAEAQAEKKLKINSIATGKEALRRLTAMGIHIDDEIIKLNNPKWGPVLVQNISNGQNKLALGRGLAEKILVEYEN
ncbi:ferrous iron transport protein A [Bacteroidetes/Chlorobi group bacterium ChocPot_Mid]|jgi:Fe2+ transport system protein FeoA|nr:MAG: ferrous iron transport protein A [Bacteroidetes/Chlorobi group bacterium ChocPot_Mid]